jgi:hypothetical protein
VPRFPKTPRGIYNDISRRYFDGELPTNIEFKIVEDLSEVDYIDTRIDEAATIKPLDTWIIYINAGLLRFLKHLYLTIAHECIHVRYPNCNHGDKVWNREVRRLQGLGLFRRLF